MLRGNFNTLGFAFNYPCFHSSILGNERKGKRLAPCSGVRGEWAGSRAGEPARRVTDPVNPAFSREIFHESGRNENEGITTATRKSLETSSSSSCSSTSALGRKIKVKAWNGKKSRRRRRADAKLFGVIRAIFYESQRETSRFGKVPKLRGGGQGEGAFAGGVFIYYVYN